LVVVGVFEELDVDDESVHLFEGELWGWSGEAQAVALVGGWGYFQTFRDDDPVLKPFVVGFNEGAALLEAELADDGLVVAVEDFVDATFGAVVAADAGDAGDDAVVMHGAVEGFGWDEDVALDVGAGRVGDDKAETVAVDGEAAGGVFAGGGGEDEVAAAEFDEGAFADEAADGFVEAAAVLVAEGEFAGELFVGAPGLRHFGDEGEDGFVAKGAHRVRVACGGRFGIEEDWSLGRWWVWMKA
jgi:hypothetical protein